MQRDLEREMQRDLEIFETDRGSKTSSRKNVESEGEREE